jgi:hypothetical protein
VFLGIKLPDLTRKQREEVRDILRGIYAAGGHLTATGIRDLSISTRSLGKIDSGRGLSDRPGETASITW